MDKPSFGFSFQTALPAATTSAQPTTSTAGGTKDVLTTLTSSTSTTSQISRPIFTFPRKQQDKENDVENNAELNSRGLKFPPVRPATGTTDQTAAQTFTFKGFERMLESEWRNVEWTEEQKMSLMKSVSSYKPRCEGVTQARVLLLGPAGSGKSSFISSVQSVFSGRVTNRAMVGSSDTSFTKKLQSFKIRGQKAEDPTSLVLCDVMGLGDEGMTGLTLHDVLSIIKGHVPEGHKFSPDQPVRSETAGYVKKPTLKDRIHCVAYVVDASKILTYNKGLRTTFQQLREHISDLGVHQVALLTHIDKIGPQTAKDVSQVYKSCEIKEMMDKAGALLGMSTSYIVPVKNYSSELDVDVNTDVLLLSAVDHILQYADLFFQDNAPKCAGISDLFD